MKCTVEYVDFEINKVVVKKCENFYHRTKEDCFSFIPFDEKYKSTTISIQSPGIVMRYDLNGLIMTVYGYRRIKNNEFALVTISIRMENE